MHTDGFCRSIICLDLLQIMIYLYIGSMLKVYLILPYFGLHIIFLIVLPQYNLVNRSLHLYPLHACGVPQWSVPGPLLFTLYILPLSKLMQSLSDISYHIYADDI